MSAAVRELRDRRWSEGLCTECGKEPALESSKIGKKCQQRMVRYTREWRRRNRIKAPGANTWQMRRTAAVARSG